MPDDRDRKSSQEEAEDEADEEQSENEADEDEDEADEAEPEEPKKKPAARGAKAEAPAKQVVAKKRRPAPTKFVVQESTIAAPSRETLVWLGVMAVATLGMWGSARFACNAHPAQTRKPRDVTTAELSRDPKDAALEMQQRWNAYDFKGALELAKGPVAEEIQKAQTECEKDASGCAQKRNAAKDKALATAALLSRGPDGAKVRVVSRGGALGEQTVVYAVEQEGTGWKVSGRAAAPAPAPSAKAPEPAPSASAP